jgi:hypothetical protein
MIEVPNGGRFGRRMIYTEADGLGPVCDCGHPVSFHTLPQPPSRDPIAPCVAPTDFTGPCGYSKGHSHIRCACTAPTVTGVDRDERFDAYATAGASR